jgi:hypothetical protein
MGFRRQSDPTPRKMSKSESIKAMDTSQEYCEKGYDIVES